MRLAEAYIASNGDSREVKKALRLWSNGMMTIFEYDYGRGGSAYDDTKKAGVENVKWITEEDERMALQRMRRSVTAKCIIDSVPPKPHMGCRCYFEGPVEIGTWRRCTEKATKVQSRERTHAKTPTKHSGRSLKAQKEK